MLRPTCPGRRRSAPSRPAAATRLPRLGAACPRARARSRAAPRARARAGGLRRLRGRSPPRPGTDYAYVRRRRAAARPVLALAARGPARPVARARHRRVRVDRRRLAPPSLRDTRALRAARRHVHARGHVRGGDPAPARAARARGHDDRADAGRPSSPAATAGATTASTSPPPTPPTAARSASQRLVDAAHARGPRRDARRRLQPPRRLRRAGDGGVRAVPDRQVRDAVGQGGQPRRRAVRPVREWILQSAERWIRDFHLDGLRLDAIHALIDSNPEHIVAAIARRVHAADPARARDRRVRPERPEGDARARARRLGLRRRLGRRLPPRAARRADRRDRRLVRASSPTSARWSRRSTARTCTTAPTRASASRRFGAPADDVAPERFVVFSANHDQVGNRAFGDRLPVAARPLAALLDVSGTVHADALPGRGVRRARAVPVLLRPHRRRDRRGDPRGPPARVRRVRVVRARGARSAGPRDVRARPS